MTWPVFFNIAGLSRFVSKTLTIAFKKIPKLLLTPSKTDFLALATSGEVVYSGNISLHSRKPCPVVVSASSGRVGGGRGGYIA